MTVTDLATYEVVEREPTHIDYRGLDVYGMAPPSSGGSTVGEALNILEHYELAGTSTTHLVTADRWGDVVSYTLTIEQTGGSGITVPGRGFLLNNELTELRHHPTRGG